jgi:hypothetical protein
MARKDKNFVFVVGAGASRELGLPTGKELLESISALAKSNYDSNRHLTKYEISRVVEEAIFASVNKASPLYGDFGNRQADLRQKAVWLSKISLLAPSIDNVLHTHKDDLDIVNIGKIMIAHCLLAAERGSLISNIEQKNGSISVFPFVTTIGTEKHYLSDTWLGELFRLLVELRDYKEFIDALSRITFISFNYDRCIEQFLVSCATLYFRLSDTEAQHILENIRIVRPYGTLGSLRVANGLLHGFGGESVDINLVSNGIKTFTEQIDDASLDTKIHDAFNSADIVFFLGFGFLDLNLDLLFKKAPFHVGNVLGTHYGMSADSADIIEKKLTDAMIFGRDSQIVRGEKIGIGRPDLVKLENMTCRELLSKHQMFLRS